MSEPIPFNRPCLVGNELEYMAEAVASGHSASGGPFTRRAADILQHVHDADDVLLTTSCTDALEMARVLGHERFHVVGHDWGGQLSWLLAAYHPERIRSLSVLSRPHPAAFAAAFRSDPQQASRSKHHKAFQNPETVGLLLENGAARLRRSLVDQGVPTADIDAYLSVLGDPATLEAAVNWYRAAASGESGLAAADVPAVTVSTLYIWGDADSSVGEAAARGTADFVTGPYRLEVLPGVGHFVTDQAGDRVTELLLDFLSAQ